MAKAYSYVRFSTLDQIKGDSQRRQTEAADEWCRRNSIDLVESYRDLGVSAFRGKNAETGALAAFLSLVRAGRIAKGSYLIVESLDRVSRNSMMEAFDLFFGIIKAGVKLVTLSDNQVYDRDGINNNWTPLIISLTVLARANEESRMKSLRLSAAWDAKRKNIANKPLTRSCVAWVRFVDGRFKLIPERAEVIRRIFDMARSGRGANGIAKELRATKAPLFGRGRSWSISYVKKILSNRAAIGEFTPGIRRNGKRVCGDPVPGYYPVAVSAETFATVQQLRKARPSYRGRSSVNVFSHIAFDRETGSGMSFVSKNRKRGLQYLVSSAALNGLAPYNTWRYDEFLAVFLTVCQQAALEPANTKPEASGKLNLVRSELDDVNKAISRLVGFLERGESASAAERLRDMEATKGKLERRIQDLESESTAHHVSPSKVDWTDTAALRDNLRATVKRIDVDAKARSFVARFFDGRAYTLTVANGIATITVPDEPQALG